MAAAEAHVKNMEVTPKLKALLKEFPALRVDEEKGRVCCCLTGHEMPPKVDAVLRYVKGKRFLEAQAQREYDYDQFKPHLVPNTKRNMKNSLFCTLTLRCVTRRPADVERHVKGKRYQRALKRWQKCQETGEVFKPRAGMKKREEPMGPGGGYSGGGRKKSKGFWKMDSDDDDDDGDSADDLEDLYPEGDFASSNSEEGEEGEQPGHQGEPPTMMDDDDDDDDEGETSESEFEFDRSETPVSKSVPNGSQQCSSSKALKRTKPQKPGSGRKKMRT